MSENHPHIFSTKGPHNSFFRTVDQYVAPMAKTFVLTEILAMAPVLHPEDSELCFLHRGVERRTQAQSQHLPAVGWIYHPIIPKAGTAEIWAAFSLKSGDDRFFESVLLFLCPLLPLPLPLLLGDCCKHSCRLLPSHHGDPGVWPHEEEPRVISSATHSIITSTIASSHNQSQFWHLSTRNSSHEFGSVFCNSSCFRLLPHHEASDVLQEQQRDVPLAAKFYEVSSLQSTLRKKHSIVANHTHWGAVEAAKTTNQGVAILCLKLIKFGTIKDSRHHLAHVKGFLEVVTHNAIKVFSRIKWLFNLCLNYSWLLHIVEIGHTPPGQMKSVCIINCIVVGDTA